MTTTLSTSMKAKAAEFFDLAENELNEFVDEPDLYNEGNTLSGFLSRRMDHRYGALYITHVNGRLLYKPHVVWGTPKTHYPFDKLERFCWPSKIQKLNVYEKIDGTNVVAYSYPDPTSGKRFVTYKTRLTPIMKSGRFGAFSDMWKEILKKYPDLPNWVNGWRVLSFELYGARNLHLIVYKEALDAKLLFGVDQRDHSVIDPSYLVIENDKLPPIPAHESLASGHDVNTYYKKLQAERESMNVKTEFGIEGGEGYMFYAHDEDNQVTIWKCKPSTIQEIHWAAGGLSKILIRSACFKAGENGEINMDTVKTVLREDFDGKQIEAFHYKIGDVIGQVKKDLIFRYDVRLKYTAAQAETGATLQSDKRTIMRWMSNYYEKKEMSQVYFVISNS